MSLMTMVQIPLWTIVTNKAGSTGDKHPRSDSSMDDCNGLRAGRDLYKGAEFRFLYGRL